MPNCKYNSDTKGKISFIHEVVEPWLSELGYHEIAYYIDNGNEYILLEDKNNEPLHIDISGNSIQAIVINVSRWIVRNHW